MQTMHPVLLYGQYEWDQHWLPQDEFETRLAGVRRIMAVRGWKGVVVHGDSQENGLLCYLTNFIPNQRWGLALIGSNGPPRLIAPVGSRDLPAVQKLTWVQDIRATSDIANALSTWLQEVFPDNNADFRLGKIGFANAERMRFDIAEKAVDACRRFSEVEDASSALVANMRGRRPREIALLRQSYRCLQVALGEVERVRRGGSDCRTALLAGERSARLAGAQDVRALCSVDNTGALRPVGSQSPAIPQTGPNKPWTLHFALRRAGYWAEAMGTITAAPSPALRAVRRALAATAVSVRAGVGIRNLISQLETDLRPYSGHPFLGTGLCRAGGLSLDGEPWLRADSDETLVEDAVYTLATGVADGDNGNVLLSTSVLARAAGQEILWPVTSGTWAA